MVDSFTQNQTKPNGKTWLNQTWSGKSVIQGDRHNLCNNKTSDSARKFYDFDWDSNDLTAASLLPDLSLIKNLSHTGWRLYEKYKNNARLLSQMQVDFADTKIRQTSDDRRREAGYHMSPQKMMTI